MSTNELKGHHLYSKSTMGRLVVLLMAASLMFAGNALAKHSRSALVDTEWTGDITAVDVNGNTTVLTGASLKFVTESDDFRFLSGTLSTPAISFSAIRHGDELILGAVGYIISADIDKHHGGHHRRNNPDTLKIRGSNVTDGSTFVGTLTKQE
jgi:hypothetical protein